MKVARLFFVVFFVLALAGALQAQTANPQVPVVQMSETSWNFGELIDGREYAHDFMVKNAGTAPLEIKKVLPG
ncbi:MAG: DUF1573 domain-containing protein [Desulfobacteraceae bacterium]|nr:DUF1573 domain-containing protein [Desulfobacteraceae bacterium]